MTTSDFAAATAVTETAPGCFTTDIDAHWGVAGRPNGGYLLASLQRAALLTSGRPHPLSISAVFLRPPAGGAAEIEVESLHTGSTVATAKARLVQAGQVCVETLVASGTLATDVEAEWVDGPAPQLPPIEECLSGAGKQSEVVAQVTLLDHVDVRLDPVSATWANGTAGRPEFRGFVRLVNGADPDPLVATLAADALPPVVFAMGRFGWAPTVEMTVHTRSLPAPGPLRVRSRTRLVADGWFDEEAEVWDSAGRLVTQSRQLARVGRS